MGKPPSKIPQHVHDFVLKNPEATKEQVVQHLMRDHGFARAYALKALRNMEKSEPVVQEPDTAGKKEDNVTVVAEGPTGVPPKVSGELESLDPFAEAKFNVLMGDKSLYYASKSMMHGMMTLHRLNESWETSDNASDIPEENLVELRRVLIRTLRAVENRLEDLDLLGRVTKRG